MTNTTNWAEADFGLQREANPNRSLTSTLNGRTFHRLPVRTHLVQLGENYVDVVGKYTEGVLQPGDILACSEKFIGICQKRVVHESEVEASWLAKLIARFVVKYKDDVGWENPKKIQVAINEAGWLRSLLAVVVGGVMKFVFQQPGWYYRIMGKDIEAIDGFNPIAIPPFNEYATLAPAEPDIVSEKIKARTGAEVIVIDASNIAIHILGRSSGVKYNDAELVQILAGNAMGQGREQTPILVLREVNAAKSN
jgi:hypothetical protein